MKYDVFISYKNEDKNIAIELDNFLKENELTTFIAEKTIDEADYAEMIDDGIENSQNLIVITTKATHLTTKWVKYEWKTFNKEILSDRKNGQILTIIGDGVKINDMPLTLRNLQVFLLSEYQEKLLPFLTKKPDKPKVAKKKWWQNFLEKTQDFLLFIGTWTVILALAFAVLFCCGAGVAHFQDRKKDNLRKLASNYLQIDSNGNLYYPFFENEDIYYNPKENNIEKNIEKTEETKKSESCKEKKVIALNLA